MSNDGKIALSVFLSFAAFLFVFIIMFNLLPTNIGTLKPIIMLLGEVITLCVGLFISYKIGN